MTRSYNKNRNYIQSKKKDLKKDLTKETHSEIKSSISTLYQPWTPSGVTAFKALLSACLCSAVWTNISDCDETYNYWEPAHYLIYGKGYQTWEYSPIYALRSYGYLLLYVLPGKLYQLLIPSNKIFMFYFIRFLMALACAGSEAMFYRAICHHFGANIGRLTLLFLVLSSGMFVSCTAFLPSTFAMYMVMLSYAAWFQREYKFAILGIAVGTLVGWPFVALLGVPIAMDIVVVKKRFSYFLKWSLISLLTLVPLVTIDSNYYGKLVIAPLNIIFYNIFTSHGPNLYGTEPWSFYFLNGFLNFNVVFVAALVSLPMFLCLWRFLPQVRRPSVLVPHVLSLVALYLWMLVFILQPHKEERFLFPVFPLICLSGAVTIDCLQKLYFHLWIENKSSHYLDYSNWIAVGFCVLFTVLSVSRSVGAYKAYRAPMETYIELTRISQEMESPREVHICSGKEWYRFPSSFFLPPLWTHHFIESEFRGQLPQPYANHPNATLTIPTNMNDLNQEERSRYVSLSLCDFLIDADFPSEAPREPRYVQQPKEWKTIFSIPFLDAARSPRLLRSFYVPFLTEWHCTFVDYNLLKHLLKPSKKKPVPKL